MTEVIRPTRQRSDQSFGREHRLQKDIEGLQTELGGLTNGPGHDNSRYVLQSQINELQGKLSGLNEIQARLDTNPSLPEDRRYYLLGIDSTGDGKAIVATGNPDTAQNVATFVPGTGTDLATIGSTLDRSDVMHRAADKTGAGRNSMISWLGYDAPDSVHNAAMSGYAEDARKPLDSFQDGLRESHVGAPSHNTVVGHSYGSTAAGSRRDQQLAENDPVADLQRFGNASPGTPWPVVGYSLPAHSEYWDPRTPSLDAMGQVIAGQRAN